MEEIRAFIAIELPDEVIQGLGRLESRLKLRQPDGVKWVDPAAIHLTLNFLGDIAPGRIGEITEAMTESVQGIAPFSLYLDDLGVFPNLYRVRVVWVGIGGEVEKLARLQHSLEANLDIIGFSPEERTFSPHLTLGRVREQASPQERQKLGDIVTGMKVEMVEPFAVNSISLIKSQLTGAGPVYSRIVAVELGK
ncbi:MAG: RNA 2',3'-cyclic phosphodiesterase [Dehalococcoidales bacterium]|nr:RNA 2',3'-cyclic phosphodiesterase [Dehalococcoidales bacterium]